MTIYCLVVAFLKYIHATKPRVETVIKTPIRDLMLALETGIHINLYQISRIVGYMSRINCWNKSKIAELRDRRRGNYWQNQRVNSEKIGSLNE